MRFSNSWVEKYKKKDLPLKKYAIEEYREKYPKVKGAEVPFSSVYKYQLSVHRFNDK